MSTSLDDLKRCPQCKSADILREYGGPWLWNCVQCRHKFNVPFVHSAATNSNATEHAIRLLDSREQRKQALAHHVCEILRGTLQVRVREHDTDDARVDFTDASLRVLAPLIEAVEILESIIWASDGCVGHRDCAHSMEPWQRARALLKPKWDAYCDPDASWPDPNADTPQGR